MISFEEYYKDYFQNDLKVLYSTIPESSLHHNGKETYTLQYERLTNKFNHLEFLGANRKSFVVSLYFTVLIDQVFYTYFQPEYKVYKELTNSPKFIGNCLSSCRNNLHPQNILVAANKDSKSENVCIVEPLNFVPFLKESTSQFLKNHLPGIQDEFWAKVRGEI